MRKVAVRRGDEDGPPCSRCGIPNRPARSFCRGCSARLTPPAPPRQTRVLPEIARAPRAPKPMSDKRLAEQERRAEVVALVRKRDGYKCQAGAVHALVPAVRCGGGLDVHEIIPRSAWPKGYLEPANCLLVCRNAHRWIDGHPYGAHALGLHRFSWERPDA